MYYFNVIVNFDDYTEMEIEFEVVDAEFKDLMGAVEYSLNKELPKYFNGDVPEYSSLVITLVKGD